MQVLKILPAFFLEVKVGCIYSFLYQPCPPPRVASTPPPSPLVLFQSKEQVIKAPVGIVAIWKGAASFCTDHIVLMKNLHLPTLNHEICFVCFKRLRKWHGNLFPVYFLRNHYVLQSGTWWQWNAPIKFPLEWHWIGRHSIVCWSPEAFSAFLYSMWLGLTCLLESHGAVCSVHLLSACGVVQFRLGRFDLEGHVEWLILCVENRINSVALLWNIS